MSARARKEVDVRSIVSDEEVERVHANANFGSTDKRHVVNTGVWHVACGWHSGHTVNCIVVEHGLARWRKNRHEPLVLTAKGRRYLFAALKHAKIEWPP